VPFNKILALFGKLFRMFCVNDAMLYFEELIKTKEKRITRKVRAKNFLITSCSGYRPEESQLHFRKYLIASWKLLLISLITVR